MPVPSPTEFKRARRTAAIAIAIIVILGMLTRVYEDNLGSVTGPIRLFLMVVAVVQIPFWRLAFSSYGEAVAAIDDAERRFKENPAPPPPTSRETVRQWSTFTKVLIVLVFVPAGVLMLLGSFFIGESWGVALFVAILGLAMLALPGALVWAHMGERGS